MTGQGRVAAPRRSQGPITGQGRMTGGTMSVTAEAAVARSDATGAETDPGTRVLAVLCTASFLSALNFFATSPFYPEIADDLGTSVPLLGQATTLMILVSVACGLLVGPLADRYGFRWPLVIGVAAVAVNLIGTGLAPAYPVLLGLSLAGGLADAVVFGLPLAVAGSLYAGEAQRRAMTWIIGSMSIAPMLGVPAMTALGDVAGWRSALLATGALTVGAAWLTAFSLPRDRTRSASRLRAAEVVAAYRPLLRDRGIVRLYLASGLRGIAWFGLLTYLGAFLKAEMGLSSSQAGLVYAANGAGYLLGGTLSARLRAVPPRMLLTVAYAVAGASVVVMLLVAEVWVTIALLVLTSLASFTGGLALASLLTRDSPAGGGTTMALNGSVMNLGAAVGAAVGGGLLAVGGYTALGLGLSVFAFAAAGLVWRSGQGEV